MGEQSGIVAGRGGYDVTAGGKVDLTGGVISSTADAEDNSLSARELAWRDVQNSSASSSSGFGVGFGVNFGSAETEAGKDVAARYPGTLTPIVNMPAREGESGATRATVTPGTLELSDQRQDLASLNRDAGAAHVSVEAYDIARLKARQEGAAALSELLNGLTGDLSVKIGLKDGDPAKAALHAAVGAAVAAVAGTDIGAGAAAGLVSELANGVVSQMLKDHPELTTAQTDAIRQWTATALGAAIGGKAGAAAALDNIKHNYLEHAEKLAKLNAERALKECEDQPGSCSPEREAELRSEIVRLDTLDKLRNAEVALTCEMGNRIICGLFTGWLHAARASYHAAEAEAQKLGMSYADYVASVGGPEAAAALVSEYQEIQSLQNAVSRIISGRDGRELLTMLDGYVYGAGAGAVAAGGYIFATSAVPAAITCMQNPVCFSELGIALGEAAAGDALGGATLSVAVATGGKLLMQKGDKIVGALDPVSGKAFTVEDFIISLPKGGRPDPLAYMSQADIDGHLALFNDGAVRFTSRSAVERYGIAGNSEAFVMPKSIFESVVAEAGGDLRAVERRLGLELGYLNDSDTMAVHIQRQYLSDIRLPSGNEGGANSNWLPGGYTSGGIPEAVSDLSGAPFTEIKF